jgi:hypothetical protein
MGLETAALIGLGGAAVGGLAGSLGKGSNQDYSSGMSLGNASSNEQLGGSIMGSSIQDMQGLVGAGPGMQDVQAGLTSQRDLAAMLQQYAQSGGLPGEQDINTSNNIAGKLFQAQRLGLQQNFDDQSVEASRASALMGRTSSDPILRAKLAQEQTRQAGMLDAQQGAFSQQFALNLPGQRMGYAQQRAGLLGGLATQAMANRQALAGLGEALQTNERNFRLATASRYGNQNTQSGGGWAGGLTGALAGAGAGLGIVGMMGGFGKPAQQAALNGFAGGGWGGGVNQFSGNPMAGMYAGNVMQNFSQNRGSMPARDD